MDQEARVIRSFPPAIGANAKILILGMMPSEPSLRVGQYYANPQNAFWMIMGELFGAGPALPYNERLLVLSRAGIALWDSLQRCTRNGSLDSSIRNAVANDFRTFFRAHPTITHVFFNGKDPEAAFRRYALRTLVNDPPVLKGLPSTSSAHATLRPAAKLAEWRALLLV